MVLRIEKEKAKIFLIYAAIFLGAMNFRAMFAYFAVFALLLILLRGRIEVDGAMVLYFLISILMAAWHYKNGLLGMVHYLSPVCLYLVGLNVVTQGGRNLVEKRELDQTMDRGYLLLAVVSLGSFGHYLLNFLHNMGNNIGRNTFDIWSGVQMAATGQNALNCLMLGFSVAMIILPRKKWHRYFGVGCILFMLAYNLILATRTMIVMLLCLLAVGIFYCVRTGRAPKLKGVDLFLISLGILAILLIYFKDIGGIQRHISESLLMDRFINDGETLIGNSERRNAKLLFLSEMLKYPFGGSHLLAKYGYAHDLLLDGYDEYGILALFLLIGILITGARQLYILLRDSNFAMEVKLAFLLVNMACWLEFMVEPILAGMSWLFACYCLINGCMAGMNRQYRRHLKRSNQTLQ